MKEPINIVFVIIIIIAAISGFMLSWKYSKHAISRKDRYHNNNFQLFSKKVSWGIYWSLIAVIITTFLLKILKAVMIKYGL